MDEPSTQTMQVPSGRLAYIDGWRVVAVALVILAHLSLNTNIGEFYKTSWIGFISGYGEVGVFVFFFISGYVVGKTCLKEVDELGSFSPLAFYIRRLFRIVPPLLIYLIGAYFLLGQELFPIDMLFSSAVYLCNTSLVSCGWYGGHTWSLAFEEQFYLLFPILFSYFEFHKRPHLPMAFLVLLIVFVPFFFAVNWIGKTGFLIIHALFALGYLSAKHADKAISRLGIFGGVVLMLSVLIVFFPTDILMPSADHDTHLFVGKYYKFAYVVAIPAMVLLSGRVATILRYILSNKYIAYLGRSTYSIYLWQQLFTGPTFHDANTYVQFGAIIGMIVVCLIMYEMLELKIVRLGGRISGQIKRGGLPPGPSREDRLA
jgi:peptidoglycan/LPS O-acetylase OafA/YrhL